MTIFLQEKLKISIFLELIKNFCLVVFFGKLPKYFLDFGAFFSMLCIFLSTARQKKTSSTKIVFSNVKKLIVLKILQFL